MTSGPRQLQARAGFRGRRGSPQRQLGALAWLVAASACLPSPVPDADAGVSFPPYERDEGFFTAPALADEPWRCGMSPYRWWGTSELGEVQGYELLHTFSAALISTFGEQIENAVQMEFRRPAEHPVRVYRVRYTTQDRGSLVEATGVVAFPDELPAGPVPVLLYEHGTTGFSDGCSPSRDIEDLLGGNFYLTVMPISLFASWGYVVVAPDYLGLKSVGEPSAAPHPYFVAEPTALASLDAVRAAKNLSRTLLPASVPLGDLLVAGISQGGHAAAFTVRFQPHYAPELPVVAAAYAVAPLDLLGQSRAGLAAPTPQLQGNATVVLHAQDAWYQSSPDRLEDVLQPATAAWVQEYASAECALPSLEGPPEQHFTPALLSGDVDPWTCYGEESSLLHTSVPRLREVPALVLLGEDDDLVDNATEREGVPALCEQGEPLAFVECQAAGHAEAFFFAMDEVFDFFDARRAGEPLPADACVVTPPRRCSSDVRP